MCAFTFSFLAIPRIGLSVGQGIWGGAAIIVSFVAGLIVGQSTIKSALIILAMVLLLIGAPAWLTTHNVTLCIGRVAGVVGIALCQEISDRVPLPCFDTIPEHELLHSQAQQGDYVNYTDKETTSSGADATVYVDNTENTDTDTQDDNGSV